MVYLDNSATTFKKPDCVYSEIINVMKYSGGNAGRGGHRMSVRAGDIIYNARENISKFFNITDESRICFTYNASAALNYALKGVLKKGDHVVISSYEHNSVYRPIYALEQNGVSFSVLNSDRHGNFDDLNNYIDDNTKLVVINHVSNVTGNIAEISKMSKIAHDNGILFMVDASQSAGHIEIDVIKDGIDLLACSGHKGLFGPQGTGILYIRDGIDTKTIVEGGTGSMSQLSSQPEEFPDRFETGTLNAPGIGGLSKGVEFILEKGIISIREHEEMLLDMLINGLSSMPRVEVYGNGNSKKTSGAVGFNVSGKDCITLCDELDENYDIMLRGGLHCSYLAHKTIGTLKSGCARVSISYFTTVDEINYFLNVIDKISK